MRLSHRVQLVSSTLQVTLQQRQQQQQSLTNLNWQLCRFVQRIAALWASYIECAFAAVTCAAAAAAAAGQVSERDVAGPPPH